MTQSIITDGLTTEAARLPDIEKFLTARLDSDEATAREAAWAADAAWRGITIWDHSDERYVSVVEPDVARCDPNYDGEEIATHIGRFDPSRILDEVAAKRAILTNHANGIGGPDHSCGCEYLVSLSSTIVDPCDILRALVHPYRSHPDFDPSWAMVVTS